MTENEEEDYGLCICDLRDLDYMPDPASPNLHTREAIQDAVDTVLTRKSAVGRKVRSLLQNNVEALDQLMPDVFWLVHLKMHRPHERDNILNLMEKVGKLWGGFLFPVETDSKLDYRVRDSFVDCLPYVFTQACQYIFVLITHGLPETTNRAFRMRLCRAVVELFTRVHPLESLLQSKLASYYTRPPQVDVVPMEQKPVREKPRILLPTEDLSTLIEIPHRKRPRGARFPITGVSDLMAESTGKKVIPYEPDNDILVQYPRDGESDWTTDLPPLLPGEVDPEANMTFETYDPNKETRSLLYRSRRPNLCNQYLKLKEDFLKEEEDARKRFKDNEKKFEETKEMIRKTPGIVLKRFCEDVRALQLERKWSESPEWHSEQELLKLEQIRAAKERQQKREEEDAKAWRKARRTPRLLPYQVAELEQKEMETSQQSTVTIEQIEATGQPVPFSGRSIPGSPLVASTLVL